MCRLGFARRGRFRQSECRRLDGQLSDREARALAIGRHCTEAVLEKAIFRKENVFTCVMYGALVIFVVVESVLRPESIAVVAFLVALAVFVLSVFKVAADIAEDVNDKLTSHMRSVERWPQHKNPAFRAMREASPEDAERIIAEMAFVCKDRDLQTDRLRSYRAAYYTRAKVRVVRRSLLFCYYFVFMLLFVALLLHAELMPALGQFVAANPDVASVLTLWSLVVVLTEVMMKGLIEKADVPILENRLGFKLELY